MLKTQRLLLTGLALAFLAMTLVLVMQNADTLISIQFFSWKSSPVSLGLLFGLCGLSTGLAVGCQMSERLLFLGNRQQKTNRALERNSVTAEEAQAQTKVMEERIQTLEKALDSALKRISS